MRSLLPLPLTTSGSRTKRPVPAGNGSSALIAPVAPSAAVRVISRATEKPSEGMNGNGWVGSTAIGVSSGNTSSKNSSSSQRFSSSEIVIGSTMRMPSSASSREQFGPARLLVGRQPADLRQHRAQLFGRRQPLPATPNRPPRRPARAGRRPGRCRTHRGSTPKWTGTVARSSSGLCGFCASSSTRRLNCSQDSSRL